ncbi:hypothetical protein COBT_000821 [Conglomerata obtusa]
MKLVFYPKYVELFTEFIFITNHILDSECENLIQETKDKYNMNNGRIDSLWTRYFHYMTYIERNIAELKNDARNYNVCIPDIGKVFVEVKLFFIYIYDEFYKENLTFKTLLKIYVHAASSNEDDLGFYCFLSCIPQKNALNN